MLTDNLFESALIAPARNGANRLFVVSGYASPTMVSRHVLELVRTRPNFQVSLIVGMTNADGISDKAHQAFKRLTGGVRGGIFDCSYVIRGSPAHTKSYSWYTNETPVVGFVGSANYTVKGFLGSQREVLVKSSAKAGRDYFNAVANDAKDCNNIVGDVTIYQEPARTVQGSAVSPNPQIGATLETWSLPKGTTDFLQRNGILGQKSGLNWGQRPGREPNQAYIPLRSQITRTGFFPPRGTEFTLLDDNGYEITVIRAGDEGKNLESPSDNSILGRYFRRRIGVPLGSSVQKQDLQRYGRTTVDFYRIDDRTYLMDFSV